MTKDEVGLWKMHPVTQAFFKELQNQIGEGLAELASGMHSTDIAKTYLCVGKVNAYKSILELSFVEIEEKPNE